VKRETVDEGKTRGYADALTIDENIGRGKLRVIETTRAENTEMLIKTLNLLGGEADTVRLFKQGSYGAIASDDSRFIDLIESLEIPYMTPSTLLIYLWKIRAISKQEARQCLDKIKALISSDEYLASIDELVKE
jgi:hypothetical protein